MTGLSCDCLGFMEHQRCTHPAVLLAHLRWLPAIDPAPETVTCGTCSGGGVLVYRSFEEPCPGGGGSGEVPAVTLLAHAA